MKQLPLFKPRTPLWIEILKEAALAILAILLFAPFLILILSLAESSGNLL